MVCVCVCVCVCVLIWGGGRVEVKTACQLRPSCAKRHFSLFSCDRGPVVASRERVAGGAADLR